MDTQPVQPTANTHSPIPAGINLDGVESGTSAFLKHRWKVVALIVAAGVVVGFFFFPIGIIVIIFGLIILRRRYESSLFQAFANTKRFNYQNAGLVTTQDGLIFSLGHSRHFADIVTGTFQKWPFSLFVYSYTIGSGRDSHNYNRAVMAVSFQITLPAFALRHGSLLTSLDDEGESMRAAGYGQKLELEGDFYRHFRVYLVPNTQVDVLSILTPDLMELLLSLDKYEIEITHNGNFYIYCHGLISKKQDLIDIYSILQVVAAKIGVFADRQAVLHPSAPVQVQ